MSNGGSGTDVVSKADRAVSEPSNRALSYGQKAAGQKVAKAPPVQRKASGTVAQARESWQRMYGQDPVLSKVTIQGMADAPSKFVRDQGKSKNPMWAAWTNSPTDVYVHNIIYDPQTTDAVFPVDLILMHESFHVVQFHTAGGKPPATFEAMLQYEWKAYGLSSVFARLWDLANPLAEDAPAEDAAFRATLIENSEKTAEQLSNELDKVASITDAAKREAECMNFLVLTKSMPLDASKLASPEPLYEPS